MVIIMTLIACTVVSSIPVVGGNEYTSVPAASGDVPYIAAVYAVIDYPRAAVFKYQFMCVASIVSKEFVLTTATCVKSANFTHTIAVAVHLNRTERHTEFYNVSHTYAHEKFNYWTKDNDIAVLKIHPSFKDSPTLSSITIRDEAVNPGTLCVVSGWREDMVIVDAMLKYGNASVFQKSSCFSLWGKAGVLCAGVPKEKRSGCLLGDEGGPMECGGMLTGLRHYNMNTCFSVPEPGVYTDVATYKEWIRHQIRETVL